MFYHTAVRHPLITASAASPSSSLMLDYTTKLCKASRLGKPGKTVGMGERGSRGSWGAEPFPSFQPRILLMPMEKREGRQRSRAEISVERECTHSSSLWALYHCFSKVQVISAPPAPLQPCWQVSGLFLEEQSRIQQQVFNGVIQMKQDCIFRRNHIFM